MKVSLCPKCNVSPEVSSTEIKCPKCGRAATGSSLKETVVAWNNIIDEPVPNEPEAVEEAEEVPEEPKPKKPAKKAKKGAK